MTQGSAPRSWALGSSAIPVARGPGVEGLVGSRTTVPHTGLRPHPSHASADRDGRRDDVPLPRRVARRGARDRSGRRRRPGVRLGGGATVIRDFLAAGPRGSPAHRRRAHPSRPRRSALGRPGRRREGPRGRDHPPRPAGSPTSPSPVQASEPPFRVESHRSHLHHRLGRRSRSVAAQTLLQDGHDVVVHARNADRLTAMRDLQDRGAATVVGDLSDPTRPADSPTT